MHVADHSVVLDWLISHGASLLRKQWHPFERTTLASRRGVTGAHLSGRYSRNNKMAWRFHSLVTSVREPRTILAFGSGCSARAEVSPRSGTVLTPGRRPRGPLHDATRSPPVSALKRVQLPSARAEPAGGCCSRGSSCRS